jgi:hypothetical protein
VLKTVPFATSLLLCAAVCLPAAPAFAQDAPVSTVLGAAPAQTNTDASAVSLDVDASWVWVHREQRTVQSHVHRLLAATGAGRQVVLVEWDAGSRKLLGVHTMDDPDGAFVSDLGRRMSSLPMDPPKDMSVVGSPAVLQDTSYWSLPSVGSEAEPGMASWTQVDTGVQGILDGWKPRMEPLDTTGAAAFLVVFPIGGFGPPTDIGSGATGTWPDMEKALAHATSQRTPVVALASWPTAFLDAHPNRAVHSFRGADQDWQVHIVAAP